MVDLNTMEIREGEKIYIDGVELKAVKSYELQHSADGPAELAVKLSVIVSPAASGSE